MSTFSRLSAARGVVAACAGFAALALVSSNGSAQTWEQVVKAAEKEGQVYVHGGPGAAYAQVLTEGFKQKYPSIKVNFTGLSGRDAIPKITRERESGVYNWDVYVGGTPSILQGLKPLGAFVPLRPALILPEVLDDKAWRNGLFSGWQDKEKMYTLAFEQTVSPLAYVNWDFVKKEELQTIKDLLKPQFADKIVWDDPRVPGQGVNSAQSFMLNLGPEFLTELVSKQKIVYVRNPRQAVEWVVRGQYPIGIATATEEYNIFKSRGLGKNISMLEPKDLKIETAGPGFGTVSMLDKAPNPNAAKVYINWLLSKEGQLEWIKTGHNSRRLDVPPAEKETYPVAGKSYQDTQSEEQIPVREAASNIARKYIK